MDQEQFESQYPETARFEEIQKIIAFLKDGSSCQLLGLPGVGRSTLLSLLAHNKHIKIKHLDKQHENMHFVMANFSEIRKRPLFDAMKFLFLSLADSLRERKMTDDYLKINAIFKESLAFNDELVLFQGLKEAIDYLALERKMSIVFLLDRFEEYIPTVTSEFFVNLRTLRNRAKYKFTAVFSLNRPLETLLEPTQLAEYYEFVAGHFVYMSILDKKTTEFRISSIEHVTRKKLPKQVEESIISLTGGHGKLTKLAVELLLSHPEEKDTLKEFLLSSRAIKAALQEIWLSLSPAEQADLLQEKFDDKEVLEYLEGVGLVNNKKIGIPLFSTFLQTDQSVPQAEMQKIVYDPNTNAIRKGEIVLSDQLTSSEFRLLRYLLQNQEKIIERDEIITVVWESVKSTAGITDQAVDQLIFRLRRKIEEDPNNPTHLQTVKGRGFKFTAA